MILFLAGLFTGAAFTLIYMGFVIGRALKKEEAKIRSEFTHLTKDLERINAIKDLFAEAEKITDEQMVLVGQIDRPSASASHSRHKNGIIQKLKDLEIQKLDIFRDILSKGVDPVITMYVENEPKQIKMSEAVKIKEAELDNYSTPTGNSDSKSLRENVSHLTLVKNEDNEDDTSNPTLH